MFSITENLNTWPKGHSFRFSVDKELVFVIYPLHSSICPQSDNGGAEEYGSDNSPFRSGRCSYFNGGIRGAAFVTSSLLSQTGVEHTGILHVSDWMPTLVNLAGGTVDGLELDGFDVWQSIRLMMISSSLFLENLSFLI